VFPKNASTKHWLHSPNPIGNSSLRHARIEQSMTVVIRIRPAVRDIGEIVSTPILIAKTPELQNTDRQQSRAK
jgi:hypothetical protein